MTKKKLVEYKQMNKHSDHYWGQCCSKTVSDLVNFSSNWWATLHLKGILLSSSWGYPLKHGYDRCYLIVALEWMAERCIPPRSTVGPSILKLKCALHRMNMGDNMNIIDDVETFLSTIWFDKPRGIHEKEHWAYNDESFTASYEMHVWTTG